MKHLSMALFFIASLLSALPAYALEHWFIPNERELKTIQVENRGPESELFWLSGPIHKYQEPMEHSFEIPANGTIEIPLNEYPEWKWAHIKAQNPGALKVQVQTIFEKPFLIASGPSTKWEGQLQSNSTALILNHGVLDQTVLLKTSAFKKTVTVPALQTLRVPLSEFATDSTLEISGDGRISALVVASNTSKSMSPIDEPQILSPSPSEASAYFQVTNSLRTQSFVVEISNPTLIASARKQIAQPFAWIPRILIGQIQAGHGQVNRDFSERRKTPWSWHVSRVILFADLASIECDGSPEMLEEVLKPWLNAGTNICFWNYKVSRELTRDEVSTGVLALPPPSESKQSMTSKPSRTSKRLGLEFLRPLR